jgi:hypothetical protein
MLSNDINQGRKGEKGVPKSDQWDMHIAMPHMPKGLNVTKYHEKNTLKGESGGEVNRSIVDDIFLTRHCFIENTPNNARYYDNKWWFDFPDSWYNQHTVNKAVALRRITVKPRAPPFQFLIKISRTRADGRTATINVDPLVHITPGLNIEQCISAITSAVNNDLYKKATDNDWIIMQWGWDDLANRVTFSFKRRSATATDFTVELQMDDASPFWSLINCPAGSIPGYLNEEDFTHQYVFNNVWNRRDLYIHASFVNYTQFHYLGRNNEFYEAEQDLQL